MNISVFPKLDFPKHVFAGYGLAVFTYCLGVYFSTKLAGEEAGVFLMRLFALLAAVVVLKSTFEWGRRRGFPIRRADHRLHFGNLMSNLVMAGLVVVVLLLLSGPLVMAAYQLAR